MGLAPARRTVHGAHGAASVTMVPSASVGDKEHHMPVMHLMQIPNVLLFTAGCLAAVHQTSSRCMIPSFALHLTCLMLCCSTLHSIAHYTLRWSLSQAYDSTLSRASLMRTRTVSFMTDTSCGASFQGAAGGCAPLGGHEEQCRQDAVATGISGVHRLLLPTTLRAGAPLLLADNR